MKKLAFVFAAIVAVSFASCGNQTTGSECNDTTACCNDTTACCGDTTACCGDTTACCGENTCDSVKVAE